MRGPLLKAAAALALSAQLAACSAFRSGTQVVRIDCSEGGVQLRVNGEPCGCPAEMAVPRDRELKVEARKKGYLPYDRTVAARLNGTGITDAVGFFLVLVPGVGLLTPGAWSLDETSFSISMIPEQ